MTLSGFALYGVIFGQTPLLTERGATPALAAWALGLGGLGQTLGRTAYTSLTHRTSVRTPTLALITTGGATTLLLALVPGPIPLLVGLAILAGAVRGNFTLLQATAVIDRWGSSAYGHLSAILGAPVVIAEAFTPWVAITLVSPFGGCTGGAQTPSSTSLEGLGSPASRPISICVECRLHIHIWLSIHDAQERK